MGQSHTPGTAEEGALRGEQRVRKDLRSQSQGTQRDTPVPHTHRQEVEAAVQAGLDPQGSCHVDLGQRCHRDGVTGALSQVDSAQSQVDGQQMSPSLLPYRNGTEGSAMGLWGHAGHRSPVPQPPLHGAVPARWSWCRR